MVVVAGIRCPACGTSNDVGAERCRACGSSLRRLCPKCATELHPEARFCHCCAAPVAEVERTTSELATAEQRRLVTALFVDLTGSTELGEKLDPEELRETMQAYYSAMREEIEAEGGTVSVFVGDAVMAVYGVPVAHEDDPSRAMRTGLRLHHRIEILNQGLAHLDGVRLGVRVGIHSGEILFGQHLTPGDPRLGQLTGDALNVAARLEAAAKPGQVIVSERTARAARRFGLREIGPLSLKGKGQPVLAFEVLAEGEAPATASAVLTAMAREVPPLIGRQQELQLLTGLYHEVRRERHPRLATIIGEAGVGKSRLIQEFLGATRDADTDVTMLHGRCLPRGEGIAYWPLAEILRASTGVLIDDAADTAREKIVAASRRLLEGEPTADADRVAAALCFTIALEGSDAFARMDPRQVRQEMHDAWRWFFMGVAREQPAVVKIEDLHHAAPALVELLEDLVEHGEGRILYLCSARTELHQRIADWCTPRPRHSCLDLAPLSPDDSGAVIEMLLGASDLPRGLVRQMSERADGNPFFLEEIIRHLIDEKHIVRTDGTWRLAVEVDEAVIPDTVQMALASRIDLLGAAEKLTLQVAAVVGRDFWPGPVAHLLKVSVGEVEASLERLADEALVLPLSRSTIHGEPEYSFKHMLTRDVAYQGLPRRQRSQAHIGVADWVAERFEHNRNEMSEVLAYHYSTAFGLVSQDRRADPDLVERLRLKTFDSTVLAAEQTGKRWVVDSAHRLAQDALQLARVPGEQARALEGLGRAQLMGLDGNGAWDSWTQAAALRIRHVPEEPIAVARLCGLALEAVTRWNGNLAKPVDPDLAASYLEIGLAHAEGSQEERARLLTAAAFWPFAFTQRAQTEEQRARAMSAGEEAVAIAGVMERYDLMSAALDGITNVHLVRGHYGSVMEVVKRRIDLIPRLTDRQEIADILIMAATAAYSIGSYQEQITHAGAAEEAASEVAFFAVPATAWRGLANFRMGRWQELKSDIETTRRLLGSAWERPPQVGTQHLIAAALVHDIQGEDDRADELMARMDWGMVESLGRPTVIKAPLVAQLLTRRGRFRDARTILDHLDWQTRHEGRGLMLEARCELIAAEGAWEEVDGVAAEARAFAREAGLKALGACVDRLQGRAALAAARSEDAVKRLKKARSAFAAMGARWDTACADVDLAHALAAAERVADARRQLKLAEPVLQELRSTRELLACRELLRNLASS